MLSTSLWWLAATGQKLSLNLAPFLLLNPVSPSSSVVRCSLVAYWLLVITAATIATTNPSLLPPLLLHEYNFLFILIHPEACEGEGGNAEERRGEDEGITRIGQTLVRSMASSSLSPCKIMLDRVGRKRNPTRDQVTVLNINLKQIKKLAVKNIYQLESSTDTVTNYASLQITPRTKIQLGNGKNSSLY